MKKYEIKSDDHKEAMLKLGKLQKQRNDLIYKSTAFDAFVCLLSIAVIIALSIVFYKFFVTDFIEKRAVQIVVTVVFSIVMLFVTPFLITRPFGKVYKRATIKKAYKDHAEELKSLDDKIDTLVHKIIKNYGGEKDVILKESDVMYQKQIAKQNREYTKDRIRDNSYFFGNSSAHTYTGSSSDDSASSSDSSSYTPTQSDSYSSRQSLVDERGHEVAYRDGDRVYSSDTNDLIGYMSGNQLYSYDDGRIGEFDDDGNFTKFK